MTLVFVTDWIVLVEKPTACSSPFLGCLPFWGHPHIFFLFYFISLNFILLWLLESIMFFPIWLTNNTTGNMWKDRKINKQTDSNVIRVATKLKTEHWTWKICPEKNNWYLSCYLFEQGYHYFVLYCCVLSKPNPNSTQLNFTQSNST